VQWRDGKHEPADSFPTTKVSGVGRWLGGADNIARAEARNVRREDRNGGDIFSYFYFYFFYLALVRQLV
jgi:hypothetical protein